MNWKRIFENILAMFLAFLPFTIVLGIFFFCVAVWKTENFEKRLVEFNNQFNLHQVTLKNQEKNQQILLEELKNYETRFKNHRHLGIYGKIR